MVEPDGGDVIRPDHGYQVFLDALGVLHQLEPYPEPPELWGDALSDETALDEEVADPETVDLGNVDLWSGSPEPELLN